MEWLYETRNLLAICVFLLTVMNKSAHKLPNYSLRTVNTSIGRTDFYNIGTLIEP